MIDIKLPVAWLREKGVELELDDIWVNPRIFGPTKISKDSIVPFNDGLLDYLSITSFAWRVGGHFDAASLPIEVVSRPLKGATKWRPDAKTLMEIYTAEQSAKLTETKKETKLKLTKDDVGKEFEIGSGSVFKSLYFKNEQSVLEGPVGDLHVCDSYGYMDYLSVSIIKRLEPRWWLKDLPDADTFILFGTKWLTFVGGSWHASQDEPILNDDHFHYSPTTIILSHCLMPQLKGDEWKLSKISIDDLREWKRVNK